MTKTLQSGTVYCSSASESLSRCGSLSAPILDLDDPDDSHARPLPERFWDSPGVLVSGAGASGAFLEQARDVDSGGASSPGAAGPQAHAASSSGALDSSGSASGSAGVVASSAASSC